MKAYLLAWLRNIAELPLDILRAIGETLRDWWLDRPDYADERAMAKARKDNRRRGA